MDTYRTSNSEIILYYGFDDCGEYIRLKIYDWPGFLGIVKSLQREEGDLPAIEFGGHLPLKTIFKEEEYFTSSLEKLKTASQFELNDIIGGITGDLLEAES